MMALTQRVPATRTTRQAYEEVKPFTITFTSAFERGTLKLEELFYQLPITEVECPPAKGKSKPKLIATPHAGAILSANFKINGRTVFRGANLETQAFNNCITLTMTVTDETGTPEKNISLKLFADSIQSTGSRSTDHTLQAFRYLKSYLVRMTNVCSIPVAELELKPLACKMNGKSFQLGFRVNRDGLRGAIDKLNGFHTSWMSGVNSNGVNIKYPVEPFTGPLMGHKMPRCITFIVFTTGSMIMIGDDDVLMKEVYNRFHDTLDTIRDQIELKIKQRH
jgi:hypothetical protein